METQTITNEINSTLEGIYDFIKSQNDILEDFVEYKKTLGINNVEESKMKEYYIPYIFERNLPEHNLNPIQIYNLKNKTNISEAMENSFTSVFQIKRVLKNGFEAYNIINEKTYTLLATTRMTDYRGLGIGQYIVARVFNLDKETYILEISGHLASSKTDDATRYAMAKIIQEPYLVYEDNAEKQAEIEKNIKFMYEKFQEAFNSDEIITTNLHADDIIGNFNDYVESGTPINLEGKLELPETLKFFEIKDLEHNYDDFVEKSLDGFSSHKSTYDTGIIYDKDFGLYVIPFHKTLSTILEENSLEKIEGAKDCIKYFFDSATISANILKRIFNKYPNLLELANSVLEENLTFEELLKKYKYEYLEHKIYSQTTILYNSNVFTNTLAIASKREEEAEIDYTNVGRNDLCPCGSGKKYKNCCLKK